MTDEQRAKKQELNTWKRGRLPILSQDGKLLEFSDGSAYALDTNCYGKPAGLVKVRGRKK